VNDNKLPDNGSTDPAAVTSLARVPWHSWRVFLIGLVGVTFANLDHSLFAFVLTEIAREFQWSVVERGWYIAITFIVAGILITQIGVLADRLGRRAVLLAATLVTPLFVAALTWVPGTVSLLIARTLGFTAAGVQSPITGTLVMEESPPRFRGLFTGVLQIGFPLGFFLASLLVPFVYETWGWRYIFLLALLFLPYAWVIWRYLGESRAWRSARDKRAALGAAHPRTRDLFRPEYRRKTILLFIGQFLHVFAFGATILLTAYFVEGRGWQAIDAIRLVGNSYLVGAFGYIAASFVGDYLITRRNVIFIWCVLGGLAFAAMIWWAQTWWQTFATFGLMTFFFYGAYAVVFTFIAENFPPELRATAASFSSSFAVELGLGIGPLALSYVIVAAGWQWAFTWCAVLPVIAAGVTFLGLRPVEQRGT
jgi:MFS family permease